MENKKTASKKKISIIFDVTHKCPHNCQICCMGATLQGRPTELSFKDKMDVVAKVKELKENGYDVKVDLSGGEIFTNIEDHKKVIKAFSKAIGRENLGISCSGMFMTDDLAEFLKKYVADVEMTMDTLPDEDYEYRPKSYAKSAAKALIPLKKAGVKIGIQTVVTKSNCSLEQSKKMYEWLCKKEVDEWSILKFMPFGRGEDYKEAEMTDSECEKFVEMIRKMDKENRSEKKPKIDFSYMMPGQEKYNGLCRCVRHSIGILPDGEITSCFWAVNRDSEIMYSKFKLGNVKWSSLLEILKNERKWSFREHECELCKAKVKYQHTKEETDKKLTKIAEKDTNKETKKIL